MNKEVLPSDTEALAEILWHDEFLNKHFPAHLIEQSMMVNKEVFPSYLSLNNSFVALQEIYLSLAKSEISKLIHSVDGLMYMDGANLNALVGIAYPSEMGFDIAHINLHKTFSTPHGGGGPGSGPIAVVDKLVQFLPIPIIDKEGSKYILNYNKSHSIGHIHSFFGNFGILVRAYTYIRLLGEDGVKNMTRKAILNANYLKSRLIDHLTYHFLMVVCMNL